MQDSGYDSSRKHCTKHFPILGADPQHISTGALSPRSASPKCLNISCLGGLLSPQLCSLAQREASCPVQQVQLYWHQCKAVTRTAPGTRLSPDITTFHSKGKLCFTLAAASTDEGRSTILQNTASPLKSSRERKTNCNVGLAHEQHTAGRYVAILPMKNRTHDPTTTDCRAN